MTAFTPFMVSPTRGPGDTPPIVYFDDFLEGPTFDADDATIASAQGRFSELANMGAWLVTVTDGGADNGETILLGDNTSGGHVIFVTNDANNDALSMQLNGEAWILDGDKQLSFEIRFQCTDMSEIDWFVGLAITGTGVFDQAERIGFASEDSTGDIDAVCEAAGTATTTDTGSNLVDATFVILRFVATASKIQYYVDGVLKATHTTNITDDNMTPTIILRNDGAAAQTSTVDYIMVSRER